MKTKAYFSRQIPFFLMGANEMTDDQSFDAYPVEVDKSVLRNVRSIRKLMLDMNEMFENGSAPEDCADQEAAAFASEVRRIFKTVAQDNTRGVKDEANSSKSSDQANSSKSSEDSEVRETVLREDV